MHDDTTPEPARWALDPFTTDRLRFKPVPNDGRAVYLVLDTTKADPFDMFAPLSDCGPMPPTMMTRAKEYASPALRWRGWVYVAEHDEERLLAALQDVERFLVLMALAAGAP